MTTLQINSNDKNAIKKLLDIAKQKFHLEAFIVENISVVKPKTQWGEFAKKMDGLFTSEIVQHISTSRKEARDNFVANI